MDKIYVNSDFYVKWIVDEDVSSDTVTIERVSPSGTVTSGLPANSVVGNTIRYELSRSLNTAVGTWKFQAKVVRSGKVYYTQTIYVVVHERFT